MSLAAVAAGTALSWTSPVNGQLNENTTLPVTDDQSKKSCIFIFNIRNPVLLDYKKRKKNETKN